MVPGDADRVSGRDHPHHQPQHAGGVRTPVDQVADEDGGAAERVRGVDGAALGVADHLVVQPFQQGDQFGAAAVDVADDVERTGEVAQVVVALLQDDLGGVDLGDAAQQVHRAEALALQVPQRAAQLPLLTLDHMCSELRPVGAQRVAFGADLRRDVQHDSDRQYVVLPCQLHQLASRGGLDVGRVDHGEPPGREPLRGDVVQHVEGVGAGRLVVGVVADHAPAGVGGKHLGGQEVPGGEAGLARAGGADQDHQRQVGDGELAGGFSGRGHRSHPCSAAALSVVVSAVVVSLSVVSATVVSPVVDGVALRLKAASWVGGPTSGSSGPTGAKRTV